MKLKSLAILVGFSLSCFGMDVIKLPDSNTLYWRLMEIKYSIMDDFIQRSGIDWRLHKQSKTPEEVATAINLAFSIFDGEYARHLPADSMKEFRENLQPIRPKIFEAILKDSPEALEHLKAKGLYTPAK